MSVKPLGALLSLLALPSCTVYRAYSGDARPKEEVASIECDQRGVSVQRVDRYPFSGGWSEFEVVAAGKHELVAELFWTRLETRVELPARVATFTTQPGKKYFCVFDVDEQKQDWALFVVPLEQVSWKSRTFHGARTWRTPQGECVSWDEKRQGCLGDAEVAVEGDSPGRAPSE